MYKLVSLLLMVTSYSIYASTLVLVSDNKQVFFIQENHPFNLSGILETSSFGLCLEKNCSKSFNLSEAFSQNFAFKVAVPEIPEDQKNIYKFPDYDLTSTSQILRENGSLKEIEVSSIANIDGMAVPIQKVLYQVEQTSLKVDFSKNNNSESNRISYTNIQNNLKKYHKSVFQIIGEEEISGLGGEVSSHGTGFFISKEGYALTNLHVMESNKNCLSKKSCTVRIKQKSSYVKNLSVRTRILTCSKINDFCLIKIFIPSDFDILPLEISLNKISTNLMTLGFPGDKFKDFADSNEVDLTYSFGSPMGISGTAISSSLYIAGGASGSPIIDLNSGKAVGLNSNGAATFADGKDGMPAIFRTIFIIDKNFEIRKYLDGSKQKTIEFLIAELTKTPSAAEAIKTIEAIESEKSYYGRGKLEVLSYSHLNAKVRKLIFKYLKNKII